MRDENPIRTLGYYSRPSHKGYRNTIKLPDGNNVVPLRSNTIRLVQNGCSFHELWSEDPNQQIKDFLKPVDSVDLDVANNDPNSVPPVAESTHGQTNDELTYKEMIGSSIEAQVKKAKLFNEWERKDLYEADHIQLYDFLKFNQAEVDEIRAERLAKSHDPLALMAHSQNPYNYPMFHSNPTTAMNMAHVQMDKAFKPNYYRPTKNNQRISSNPGNMGLDRQMQIFEGNGRNQFGHYAGQIAGNQNENTTGVRLIFVKTQQGTFVCSLAPKGALVLRLTATTTDYGALVLVITPYRVRLASQLAPHRVRWVPSTTRADIYTDLGAFDLGLNTIKDAFGLFIARLWCVWMDGEHHKGGDLPVLDLQTMEELCQPTLNGRGGPIAPIAIQATNFGLKNDMIQQVQNSCQFHGLSGNDANKHLDKFLHVTQRIKVNGVTDDALRLYLFPHSLIHHATAWFDHFPRNSITTFEQIAKMFLGKYFPPSMVTKLRNEITNFRQRPDELLFEAWERYKLSIDRCPNHNIRSNRRHVPNIVEPEIRTIEEVVPMADRSREELLQAPMEGYEEAIVILEILTENFEIKTSLLQEAWERFKEILRACPHHGFSKLTQIYTFYNGLNEQDWDSLNAAAGGNLLSKTTRGALKIIENKSKVHYSRSKSNVSRVNTNSRDSASKTDDIIDKLADQISNLVEIVNKQVITPATAKAVEKTCVICGGAHAYYDCIATDSNQPSFCAATGTYNQVSPLNRASNQIPPPGFAPVQNNPNRYNQNQGHGNNFNRALTSGTLLSNNVPNPKGEMKAVTTRSGLAYEGPLIPTNSPLEKLVERDIEETTYEEHSNCQGSTAHIQPPVVPISIPKPDVPRIQPKPNIPYPSRLNDQKLREKATNQMEKFFQIFHDLHFDISFADALLLMPKFASTIKSLLMNKDKLFELAKVNYPSQRSCRRRVCQGGEVPFSYRFMVVDFKANPRVPLILERSFLRTVRNLIDVYGEEITLKANDESVTFNLNQTMRYSSTYDDNSVNRVDVIDIACEEFVQDVLDSQYNPKSSNPTLVFEETKRIKNSFYDPEGDILYLEKLLNNDPFQLPLMDLKQAEETKAKSSIEEPPEQELKELPKQNDAARKDHFSLPFMDQMLERSAGNEFYCFLDGFSGEGIVLGHKISKFRIGVDREKVDVIAKLPHPTTVKGVRSFLGHACFYQHFIQDFSKIARPTTHLLEKETPFVFSKECVDAFDTLKKKLTEAPILVFPDWNLPFELMCDANDFANGAVLGQRSENLAADHLSRLENPHKDVLKNKDINKNFPLETLGSLSSDSTPWFADIANFHVGNFIKKGLTSQQKKKFFKDVKHYRAKVDVIAKLPHPTTVKGVRSFLGHAGFYRCFIKDFFKIARPMTHLLEKETPFVFSKECVDAFNTLKKKLTEDPILVVPDWNLPFELMCDASDFALRAVLGHRKMKHF
nr:reverse transcriptase domain-containing protein [Tanacetum cinerariifolium]